MYKTETHLHTAEVSPCGKVGAGEMIKLYAESGYSTVFVSDHLKKKTLEAMGDIPWVITIFGLLERKITYSNEKSKKYGRIQKAITYIEENYQKKPDNEYLSKLCYMSKYYFIKTFTAEVGITPQKYCTMIIIDKSKHLLDNTNMKIGDIAKAVGIDDVLYFSKLFKKTTGISPSEYRTRA